MNVDEPPRRMSYDPSHWTSSPTSLRAAVAEPVEHLVDVVCNLERAAAGGA
jgi:hypothetical protein